MSLGSPSLYQWGTPFWGDIDFDPSLFVKLESIARGELQRTCTFDSIAQLLGAELMAAFDSVGLKTLILSCAFDVFQGRVPSAAFLAECTQNVLLMDVRLPAGTRRFATIPLTFGGEFYEGRQVTLSDIQRTQGSGTDDLQVTLDDTDFEGQDRLRDLFLADAPEGSGVTVWVVLLNDKAKNRYQLFEGNIERVTGFSRAVVTLDIVRNEAVEDVELGESITLAEFPNAPDESLSKTKQIVLGSVENHEGIAINVNALGKLAKSVPAPPTPPVAGVLTLVQIPGGQLIPQFPAPNDTILLRDARDFPASGVVLIGSEEIEYTGKIGDELTGLTRGFNGTLAGEHPKGAEAKEVGDYVLLMAGHVLGKMDNITILGSDGVLGEPVPAPSALDYNAATITWPETPKVRNPNAASEYQRVHFKDVDGLNSAKGAEFAARENASYRAFGVAQLGQAAGGGTMVLRTNTDGIGTPGDLLRVWIAVIFDPETLGIIGSNPPLIQLPNGNFTPNPNYNPLLPGTLPSAISGGASVVVSGKSFNLQASDLVPEEIARNDEKTGDRIYDVPDPVFAPNIGNTGTRTLSPDTTIDPGIWQRESLARLIIDGDEDTEAVSFFAGIGEASLIGRGDAIFRLNVPPNLGDFKPESGTLVFIAGWGPPFVPITSPMTVVVKDRMTGDILATIDAQTKNNGIGTSLISGIERFEATIDISLFEDDLANLPDFDWIVSPVLGVSSGLWVARELFIDLEVKECPPINSATIEPKGSVTNYFEVTDLVGLSQTKDAKADWAFFSDITRGGRAIWRANVPNVDPQIIETFWVAEFTPFLEASTKVPRGFADVRGLTGPSGDDTPADIAEQIITQIPPLGMGLPSSRLARENYNPTKASQIADDIRMGFAITSPTSAVKLIEAIADQGDCRQNWDRGRHSLIRRPRADVSLPVFRTLTEFNDILLVSPENPEAPAVKLGRTPLGEVRTRITVLYRAFAPTGETSRSIEEINATAEASNLGRKGETKTLGLIRKDTSAQVIVDLELERKSKVRWVLEFDMALPGLELRFGDLVTVRHPDIPGGSFEVCEVMGLNYQPADFDRIQVTCIVWKE